MANGFLPALLLQASDVFGGIYPAKKITPLGYLRMLLSTGVITNGSPNLLSRSLENNGHTRTVTVKYRPRGVAGKSTTVDDCSIQGSTPYKEFTPPVLLFRKRSTFITDDEIRKYETEASNTVLVGNPAPPMGIMQEMWNRIIENTNGLMQDVNNDLLTIQAANFGVNVNSGNTAAKTINFPLSTQSNPLTQGITQLMQDILDNEVMPNNVVIVGNGLISNAYIQMKQNTANAKDQNYPDYAMIPDFFQDWSTAAKWGANQFGVFEKGAAQFINVNNFVGAFGGDKLTSWTGTIKLPLADSMGNNELSSFTFDFQLRYNDCVKELEVDGVLQTVGRGWIFDLMANYNQFNIPSDAYDPADRLFGVNGTYRYSATNA